MIRHLMSICERLLIDLFLHGCYNKRVNLTFEMEVFATTKRGKNINVFLMDGEANGRIKATISNWIGVAYKIPRIRLASCKERDDLSQSSVYFLFGSPRNEKSVVYIGQAGVRKSGGGILTRLMEHDKNPDKDYWTEAVVFTTSNNSFGPTELSFLENRFCNMAIDASRYIVKNANDPTPGNITEEKESELEEFADYAELILGVLGYKVFEPVESDYPTPISVVASPEPNHTETRSVIPATSSSGAKPSLPSNSLPIGEFISAAMTALSESGYSFDKAAVDQMCSSEWTKQVFHTKHPFMRYYVAGKTTNRDENNYVRFWSKPFHFGGISVLISKEWYSRQYDLFVNWYNGLEVK